MPVKAWIVHRQRQDGSLFFELLGKKVTRKARIVYAHTPEWEYFEGAAMTDEPITGMYELLDAIEAVIGSPTGSQKGMHERAWRNNGQRHRP